MTALAAHALAVKVSTTDGSYLEVDGLNDVSFGPTRDMLETTDFKDLTGAKTRMAGLKDGTISLSGDYEASDTNGQVVIRNAFTGGTDCYVQILWNGANGHKVKGIVENFSINASLDGKVEFSATIQFNGAAEVV